MNEYTKISHVWFNMRFEAVVYYFLFKTREVPVESGKYFITENHSTMLSSCRLIESLDFFGVDIDKTLFIRKQKFKTILNKRRKYGS